MCFKICGKNTDFGLFWPKIANFGPFLAKKGPILNFRQKVKRPFFTFIKPRLHEENLMRRFLRKSVRTYVRTGVNLYVSEIPRDQKVAHENLQETTQMYKIVTRIIKMFRNLKNFAS